MFIIFRLSRYWYEIFGANSIFASAGAFSFHLTDLQTWHWAKRLLRLVFYICLSVRRFVEGKILPKIRTLFLSSPYKKKRSFFNLLCFFIRYWYGKKIYTTYDLIWYLNQACMG